MLFFIKVNRGGNHLRLFIILDQEEGKGCSQRLVACLSTLYLFSKIKPDLMVKHAETLQPYLDIKCSVCILEIQCRFTFNLDIIFFSIKMDSKCVTFKMF